MEFISIKRSVFCLKLAVFGVFLQIFRLVSRARNAVAVVTFRGRGRGRGPKFGRRGFEPIFLLETKMNNTIFLLPILLVIVPQIFLSENY